MPYARVTVTLPAEVVEEIDRLERNRSAFVVEAVRRELGRRRREALRESLRNPHPESRELAALGFAAWERGLPDEDVAELVDLHAGVPVRWTATRGWQQGKGKR